MKSGTVALIVEIPSEGAEPILVEAISDEYEIGTFELALKDGPSQALETLRMTRQKRVQEDEDFGDYVENLLSQPFLPPQVREHGVQWFKSKNRIEKYQAAEQEARRVIADFAFQLFRLDPDRVDFILSSQAAEVRVRVFVIDAQTRLLVA